MTLRPGISSWSWGTYAGMTGEHNMKDMHLQQIDISPSGGLVVPSIPPTAVISSGLVPQPFPQGSRLVNLRENSKAPASNHGHHDAVPMNEFVQTGSNVGIVLDGMFLLVDIDHIEVPEAQQISAKCLELTPRVHKTPRGTHFLFRTPTDWSGHNARLLDKVGNPYGDIKALGYAVGPGSIVDGAVYATVNEIEPPPAPQWLLDLATKPERAEIKLEERPGIPYGEHDAFLVSLAGYLRGRQGLTEKAILGVLAGGPLMALSGYDDTHPYTDRDFSRIARTASKWEPQIETTIDLIHPSLRPATDIVLVGPPIQWIVRGFVPRAELVLMYGPGGIGKSSAGSWLASEVNRLGWTFCYMGTEEPPARFFGRSVLAGARRDKCFDVLNPGSLKFPRDAALIRSLILESKIDFLYIDSIYSHFEHKEGQNAAEKARDALAPLLAIAHETGCTIFGVFHTNKAGAFLGSTEMENVTRVLLEAKRKPKQSYLGIKVHKTNLYNPGSMMCLEGREEVFRDEEGNVQTEIHDDGSEQELKIIVPVRIADVLDDDDSDEANVPIEFDQDDLDAAAPTRMKVFAYLDIHPNATNNQVVEATGVSIHMAKRYGSEWAK